MISKLRYITKMSLFKTIFYSVKFKCKVIIGKQVKMQIAKKSKIIISDNKGYLSVGVKTNLPQGTILELGENSILKVNGKADIFKGSKVVVGKNAIMEIGNNTFINEHCKIVCQKSINIGSNCAIAWNVNIIDTDYHNVIIDNQIKTKEKPIVIGDHVWIGCNSTILKGTHISKNSVIGAGSVVSGNVDSNCLYGGVIANKIRKDVDWKL
ncbi:hypothetical protein LF65_01176 [Clostridium beijerinckii]|uniref:Acyltransferase n=1 Tax=Clostridium beijerinckii TaxID=1520 RepID=A0A0B5QA35_CLOBE|nr:acyltransferase [Clostridium beijerinckii]AJG97790.1 hypothetical protein LF65_01176 [Clostridium beijerinckii]